MNGILRRRACMKRCVVFNWWKVLHAREILRIFCREKKLVSSLMWGYDEGRTACCESILPRTTNESSPNHEKMNHEKMSRFLGKASTHCTQFELVYCPTGTVSKRIFRSERHITGTLILFACRIQNKNLIALVYYCHNRYPPKMSKATFCKKKWRETWIPLTRYACRQYFEFKWLGKTLLVLLSAKMCSTFWVESSLSRKER